MRFNKPCDSKERQCAQVRRVYPSNSAFHEFRKQHASLNAQLSRSRYAVTTDNEENHNEVVTKRSHAKVMEQHAKTCNATQAIEQLEAWVPVSWRLSNHGSTNSAN
jgi:hypothetical protein